MEGGGHVAFVKHTTVTENTGGKKREWWARDNLNDDYELLCTDGQFLLYFQPISIVKMQFFRYEEGNQRI